MARKIIDGYRADLYEVGKLKRIAKRLGPERLEQARAELTAESQSGVWGMGPGCSGEALSLRGRPRTKEVVVERGDVAGSNRKRPGPRCSAKNRRGEPCGSLAHPSSGMCAFHDGRLDPVELGRKGGSAPRASVAELRIAELEAELWKTRHALEQSEVARGRGSSADRTLAATLAMIDAL